MRGVAGIRLVTLATPWIDLHNPGYDAIRPAETIPAFNLARSKNATKWCVDWNL